jgi:hypothetical protein
MRSIEALVAVEQFMKRWNEKHKFLNIIDIQMVLCLDDNEDKMRRLKRQLRYLNILQEDLITEVDNRFQDNERRTVYLSLLSQTGAKIVTVERVLLELTETLVDSGLSELTDEPVSGMFYFMGPDYD